MKARDMINLNEPVVTQSQCGNTNADNVSFGRTIESRPPNKSRPTLPSNFVLSAMHPDVSIIPLNKLKYDMYNESVNTLSNEMEMSKIPKRNMLYNRYYPMYPFIENSLSNIRHSSSNNSQPLQKCPICKKYFRRMKTHLDKHQHLSRLLGTPIIGPTLVDFVKPELQIEKGAFATISNTFTCPYCFIPFNTHSNLQIHTRIHTGDKPYSCDMCGKAFTQSCNLVNHVRTHTGERPYKCPYCERAFTQSGNLTNHIRLHTAEKPFKCHFCEKSFAQSGNLSSHIRNNHRFDNPEFNAFYATKKTLTHYHGAKVDTLSHDSVLIKQEYSPHVNRYAPNIEYCRPELQY